MLSASEVATYFLTKADPDVGDLISNLKLQKLCYYAQGFYLAMHDEPLFPEAIEPWMHGPVVPELYHQYKDFGGSGITPPKGVDLEAYPEAIRDFLDEVYNVYGQYSAWKLRNMTHEEAPWVDAYNGKKPYISNPSMGSYFKTLITEFA